MWTRRNNVGKPKPRYCPKLQKEERLTQAIKQLTERRRAMRSDETTSTKQLKETD